MGKTLYLIHGWEGSPDANWFSWAAQEGAKLGFDVVAPIMPDTEAPQMTVWLAKLDEVVGVPTSEDYFICHSIGCQALLRFLQKTPDVTIGGAVLVAHWVHLLGLEEEGTEAIEIARPWLETPIAWDVLGEHNVCCIFSSDDPFVPLSDIPIFAEKLNTRIVLEQKQGHFDDKIMPSLFEELQLLMNKG